MPRFLSLAAMLTGAIALGAVAGCEHEIHLTNIPLPASEAAGPLEGPPTRIGLRVPFDIAPYRTALATALVTRLAGSPERTLRVADGVCRTGRRGRRRCWTGRIALSASPAGPLRIAADGDGRLVADVPLDYVAAPARRPSYERSEGRVTATVRIAARFDGAFAANVRTAGEVTMTPATLKIGDGRFEAAMALSEWVVRAVEDAAPALTAAIAAGEPLQAVARAWRTLHEPVKVRDPQGPWLRGRPTAIDAAGFARHDGRFAVRFAIAGPITMSATASPASLITQPMPAPRDRAGPIETRLLYPVAVPMEDVADAIRRTLPRGTRFMGQSGPDRQPAETLLEQVRVYGTGPRLAIELKLGIRNRTRWLPLKGRAVLVARPELVSPAGVLRLTDFAMPASASAHHGPEHVPVQLQAAPFVERIHRTPPYQIGRMARAIANGNLGGARRRLASGLLLEVQLAASTLAGITTTRADFVIHTEMAGQIELVMPPAATTARLEPASGRLPSANASGSTR